MASGSKPVNRKIVYSLILSANAALIALALAEGFVRIEMPYVADPPVQFTVWPPNMRMEMRPAYGVLHGVESPSKFTTNPEGVRGPRRDVTKWKNTYSILCIGGSTTEQLFLDDSRTWNALLLKGLKEANGTSMPVWVGNVGKAARDVRAHVLDMKYLAPQFHVKAEIILAGVNDMLIGAGDRYKYADMTDSGIQRGMMPKLYYKWGEPEKNEKSTPFYLFSLWKTYQRNKQRPYVTPLAIQLDAGEFIGRQRFRRRMAPRISTLPDLTTPLHEYRKNLTTIARMAHERGERLIFVTQPSIWRADLSASELDSLWNGADVGIFDKQKAISYYNPKDLEWMLDQFNLVMLNVCDDQNVECIDLAPLVPKTGEYFYDDFHFTDKGAARVAEVITGYLLSRPPFKP